MESEFEIDAREPEPLERSKVYKFLKKFCEELEVHKDHPWHQVGRCVYCSCQPHLRLYQGTIPDGHPTYKPSRKYSPSDIMRAKWGK